MALRTAIRRHLLLLSPAHILPVLIPPVDILVGMLVTGLVVGVIAELAPRWARLLRSAEDQEERIMVDQVRVVVCTHPA